MKFAANFNFTMINEAAILNYNELKVSILNQLQEKYNQKIDEAVKALETVKEARDSDTKNTAGDKFETGRAMMQIEMENIDAQLTKAVNARNALAGISTDRKYQKVEFGSLVVTNLGNYLISIGIGKVDDHKNYAISLASPIGQMLKDKTKGETVEFQGRKFEILEIV